MDVGYNQFCPIAKASEVFATRWTPLILRELMADIHTFNDIHRGVPLISRAVLAARLRELEDHGLVERRARAAGTGHEYWLTPAGNAFRAVVSELWSLGTGARARRRKPGDLDRHPGLGLPQRAVRDALPDDASSSGSSSRACRRAAPSSASSGCCSSGRVSMSAPRTRAVRWTSYAPGNIADFVAVFLGHALWRDLAGTAPSPLRATGISPAASADSARQGGRPRLARRAPGRLAGVEGDH